MTIENVHPPYVLTELISFFVKNVCSIKPNTLVKWTLEIKRPQLCVQQNRPKIDLTHAPARARTTDLILLPLFYLLHA